MTSSEKNINNKNPLGKLSKLKSNEPTIESIREEYISILEIENKITEDFGSAIQEMKKLQNIDNTDNSAVNLLYWQDTTGVHCIATDEDMLSLNINK